MNWIKCSIELPCKTGIDYSYMITDGENIGIGWYEKEEEDDKFCSCATWHSDVDYLKTDISGFPEVTHWSEMPLLPFYYNL